MRRRDRPCQSVVRLSTVLIAEPAVAPETGLQVRARLVAMSTPAKVSERKVGVSTGDDVSLEPFVAPETKRA